MSWQFNPFTGKLDKVRAKGQLDDWYVNVEGDTMTGQLNMQDNAIILQDSNGANWLLTVNTDGALVTTQQTGNIIGSPWLFYFSNI